MSQNPEVRRAALERCKRSLDLADRIGANCCVNISGSRGDVWDGPHPDNLTSETFELIVETTREIIDGVRPTRTFYTLEAMPWMFPTGPDSYLELIEAIDRERFGVHLDPVNMIWSPVLYFGNTTLLADCFAKLGPYIKNCHAKDIKLRDTLTVHLDEVAPGQGVLDYATFLYGIDQLDGEVGLLLEHLPNAEQYREAATYIRSIAASEGIGL